jgi:hypothetical protein
MSSPRFQIPREPGTLKDAASALVKACGGLEKASALTRVKPSQMQRYTAPGEPDCHMPVDVVVALELNCAQPLVTQFLALQAGGVLLRVPRGARSRRDYMRHLGAIGAKTGALYSHACEAIADGVLSLRERARVRGEALKTVTALVALIDDLDAEALS